MNKRPFQKKKGFDTSLYKNQKKSENTKHLKVKRWIGHILEVYGFKVIYEFVDRLNLLSPFNPRLSEKPKPYTLDILAFNKEYGIIITAEINGPYHYKNKQTFKDEVRKRIIVKWVKNYFSKRIEWKTRKWIHKHIAISRDDVWRGFLDYEGLIHMLRL